MKSKRYILLIFVTVLQCMLVQMDFDETVFYSGGNYNMHEVMLGIFSGCEPFSKSGSISFPYGWFALYCCSLLVPFDYMKYDLTHMGIQTISRIRGRVSWWRGKCAWNMLTSLFSYMIILLTAFIFCAAAGIPAGTLSGCGLPLTLSADYFSYQPTDVNSFSGLEYAVLLGCPLITVTALSMLQMLLSMAVKPLYSLSAVTGLLVLAIAADSGFVFTRTGMTIPNNLFYKDGYNIKCGIIICAAIIIFTIFAGGIYFRHYDILPDKEECR